MFWDWGMPAELRGIGERLKDATEKSIVVIHGLGISTAEVQRSRPTGPSSSTERVSDWCYEPTLFDADHFNQHPEVFYKWYRSEILKKDANRCLAIASYRCSLRKAVSCVATLKMLIIWSQWLDFQTIVWFVCVVIFLRLILSAQVRQSK